MKRLGMTAVDKALADGPVHLVSSENLAGLKALVCKIAPGSRILEASYGRVILDW